MIRRLFRLFTSRSVLAACLAVSAGERLHRRWVNNDPQGEPNIFCERTELPAVADGKNMVVTAHQTDCAFIAKQSMTFVYLHPADASEQPGDLIFRYDGEDPHVAWAGADRVNITVEGDPTIDKQVVNLGGIEIAYTFIPFPKHDAP